MGGQSKLGARREQILRAAERIFANKGFHEATVSEIAKEAGVSEGTIYEYFSSKEGLLFTIPEDYTAGVHERHNFHLQLIRGAANRLRAIIYLYLHTWQEHPDYAVINLMILKTNANFRKTEGYRLIRQGFQGITRLIEEGMANGEFRSDINPYVIRSVLMGAVDHIATNWLLSDRKHNLLDQVDPIMDLIMTGLSGENARETDPPVFWDHWRPRRDHPAPGGEPSGKKRASRGPKPEDK